MGFFQDIFKDPGKALTHDLTGGNSVVSKVGNSIETVLQNPTTLIETAVATALLGPAGLDIGALAGAAGSAAAAATLGGTVGGLVSAINGGNPITGALLGGVGGIAAGYTSNLANSYGAGAVTASAAGGAAAGATVALMTGTDPITGAATGGILSAVTSKTMTQDGTLYKFDDNSSLTLDANGKIVSGTDSSGTAIPSTQIKLANQAPVQSAEMVQVQAAQDILKIAQGAGSPADQYNALLKAGYTPDQITGTLGADTAGPMSQAAFQQNASIGKILNDSTLTPQQQVQQLQAAGYNEQQVNMVASTVPEEAITQAFNNYGTTPVDATTSQAIQQAYTEAAANGAKPADVFNDLIAKGYTQQQLNSVFGSNNVMIGADAATTQNTEIQNQVKAMQAAGSTPAEIATSLQSSGYTSKQAIAALGQDNADAINQAYQSIAATPGEKSTDTTGAVKPGGTDNTTTGGTTTGGTTTGGTTTGGTGGSQDLTYTKVTDPTTGNITYHYSDGSTLITDSSGNPIHSTDTSGNTYVPGSNTNLKVDTTGGAKTDTTGGTKIDTTGGAKTDTTGGTVIPITPIVTVVPPVVTTPGTTKTTTGGYTPVTFGASIPLVNPGLNPGMINQSVKPMYSTSNPNQAQYYWGAHPYANQNATPANYNYNAVPAAPAVPWGATSSAVGGTQQLDVPGFIKSVLGITPALTSGTAPGTPTTPGIPTGGAVAP